MRRDDFQRPKRPERIHHPFPSKLVTYQGTGEVRAFRHREIERLLEGNPMPLGSYLRLYIKKLAWADRVVVAVVEIHHLARENHLAILTR